MVPASVLLCAALHFWLHQPWSQLLPAAMALPLLRVTLQRGNCCKAYIQTFLSDILSGKYADILSDIWSCHDYAILSGMLSDILSGLLSGIPSSLSNSLSNSLSRILSCIYSNLLSDSIWPIWKICWHTASDSENLAVFRSLLPILPSPGSFGGATYLMNSQLEPSPVALWVTAQWCQPQNNFRQF